MLVERGKYGDAYKTLHMFVVCASLAGGGSHRLFINVARRSVEVGGAPVSCLGAPAVAGGVVGETGYAIGGSGPVLNSNGLPKGWAAALEESPQHNFWQQPSPADRPIGSPAWRLLEASPPYFAPWQSARGGAVQGVFEGQHVCGLRHDQAGRPLSVEHAGCEPCRIEHRRRGDPLP